MPGAKIKSLKWNTFKGYSIKDKSEGNFTATVEYANDDSKYKIDRAIRKEFEKNNLRVAGVFYKTKDGVIEYTLENIEGRPWLA